MYTELIKSCGDPLTELEKTIKFLAGIEDDVARAQELKEIFIKRGPGISDNTVKDINEKYGFVTPIPYAVLGLTEQEAQDTVRRSKRGIIGKVLKKTTIC